MKTCCNCRRSLDEIRFYRRESGSLRNDCIDCRKSYLASYRIKNRERIAQKKKEPIQAEASRKRAADWYQNNKDRAAARSAKRYAEDPKAAKARVKAWRADNPERVKKAATKCKRKRRQSLSDSYVRELICNHISPARVSDIPQSLVELVRTHIQINRYLRENRK